jgi:hypothetical protein
MPTLNLRDVARDALTAAKGDKQFAVKVLLAKCRNDAKLRNAIIDNALEIRCMALVAQAAHDIRHEVWRSTVKRDSGLPVNPFYAPLPDGTPLGKATRPDLLAAAEFHESQIKGHSRARLYYKQIAAHMKNDRETVEEAYTPESLQEIIQSLE